MNQFLCKIQLMTPSCRCRRRSWSEVHRCVRVCFCFQNIRSASCFDKAAAVAGIGSLFLWFCEASWEVILWVTCFSGNSAGIVLVLVLSRFFAVAPAARFRLLIRAATKRLTSFWFKSGISFRRRAESDWRGEATVLEGSEALVRSRVASASSLD